MAAAAGGDNAALFLQLALGENRSFLLLLAVMMGLGKGDLSHGRLSHFHARLKLPPVCCVWIIANEIYRSA